MLVLLPACGASGTTTDTNCTSIASCNLANTATAKASALAPTITALAGSISSSKPRRQCLVDGPYTITGVGPTSYNYEGSLLSQCSARVDLSVVVDIVKTTCKGSTAYGGPSALYSGASFEAFSNGPGVMSPGQNAKISGTGYVTCAESCPSINGAPPAYPLAFPPFSISVFTKSIGLNLPGSPDFIATNFPTGGAATLPDMLTLPTSLSLYTVSLANNTPHTCNG